MDGRTPPNDDLDLRAAPVGAGPGGLLFAYGSLQPGESRWPLIAELVDVVGPATTRGRLVSTPMGWPAAAFGGDSQVHGTLLRPRGAAAARELWRITDLVEDAGRLFVRRVIPVRWGSEVTWATAYAWNWARGAPPGEQVPDGRWRGEFRTEEAH